MTVRRYLIALLCLSTVAVLVAGNSVAAISADDSEIRPSTESGSDPMVEDSIFTVSEWLPVWTEQRQGLGFEVLDHAQLRELVASAEGRLALDEFGLPLSADELAEMVARDELRDSAIAIDDAASTLEGYAGIHYSLEEGQGVLVVSFTRNLAEDERSKVQHSAAMVERLRFFEDARWTLIELDQALRGVSDSISNLPILEYSIDIASNTVRVLVTDEAAKRQLRRIEAATVSVGEPPIDVNCTSRQNCHTNLRGGIEMDNTEPGGGLCTSGFVADHNTVPNVYMLTAGHCGDVGDSFEIGNYSHSFQTVDAIAPTQDAMRVGIEASQGGAGRFYRTDASKHRLLTSRATNTSIQTDDWVCTHSIKFGRICGSISNGSITSKGIDNFKHNILVPGNWQCKAGPIPTQIAGSSGAPVTSGNGRQAIGIVWGCGDRFFAHQHDYTTFTLTSSKVRRVETELSVTVRTG